MHARGRVVCVTLSVVKVGVCVCVCVLCAFACARACVRVCVVCVCVFVWSMFLKLYILHILFGVCA